MDKLNLTFLTDLAKQGTPSIYELLNKYGDQITHYAPDYLTHTVTATSAQGVIKTYSLYLIVPEIGYDYRVISIALTGLDSVELTYLTLITKHTETFAISVEGGTHELDKKLFEIFGHEIFNASMRFLIDQVHIKREYLLGN